MWAAEQFKIYLYFHIFICVYTYINTQNNFESVRSIVRIRQFQVTKATNCLALTYYLNLGYVFDTNERAVSISLYRICYMNIGNILMWLYKV
jgi:hypothetical protein